MEPRTPKAFGPSTSVSYIWNSLVCRNCQFHFEKFQPLDQSRQPFFVSFVIKRAQFLIRFTLPPLAMRKFVGGKSTVVTVGAEQRRSFVAAFRRMQCLAATSGASDQSATRIFRARKGFS